MIMYRQLYIDMIKENLKGIIKTINKITRVLKKIDDDDIILAVSIEYAEIYDVLYYVSRNMYKVDINMLDKYFELVVNYLVRTLDLYDDLKHKKYEKRVSYDEYKNWLEKRSETNRLLYEELKDMLDFIIPDIDKSK